MAESFLLEIGCEELPAGFIAPALVQLDKLATEGLGAARLDHRIDRSDRYRKRFSNVLVAHVLDLAHHALPLIGREEELRVGGAHEDDHFFRAWGPLEMVADPRQPGDVARPEVVAVTFHPNQAIAVLRREPVDVGVFDVAFGTETVLDRLAEIRAAAPNTRLVLLGARLDAQTIAAGQAAGVRGVADKRLPAAQIVQILERVNGGELVLPDSPPLQFYPRPAYDLPLLARALHADGFER